jgi:hypothetical protein
LACADSLLGWLCCCRNPNQCRLSDRSRKKHFLFCTGVPPQVAESYRTRVTTRSWQRDSRGPVWGPPGAHSTRYLAPKDRPAVPEHGQAQAAIPPTPTTTGWSSGLGGDPQGSAAALAEAQQWSAAASSWHQEAQQWSAAASSWQQNQGQYADHDDDEEAEDDWGARRW